MARMFVRSETSRIERATPAMLSAFARSWSKREAMALASPAARSTSAILCPTEPSIPAFFTSIVDIIPSMRSALSAVLWLVARISSKAATTALSEECTPSIEESSILRVRSVTVDRTTDLL